MCYLSKGSSSPLAFPDSSPAGLANNLGGTPSYNHLQGIRDDTPTARQNGTPALNRLRAMAMADGARQPVSWQGIVNFRNVLNALQRMIVERASILPWVIVSVISEASGC